MDKCAAVLLTYFNHKDNKLFKVSRECKLNNTTLSAAGGVDLKNIAAPKPKVFYPHKNMPRKTGLNIELHFNAIDQAKDLSEIRRSASLKMNAVNLPYDNFIQYFI